jgi:hypothetical protein
MAWGSGAFNSCNALLERVEKNDPKLIELVILPMKVFGEKDLDRLSHAIGKFSFDIGEYIDRCCFHYVSWYR